MYPDAEKGGDHAIPHQKDFTREDLYLGRDGQWTDWRNAATFATQDAAEAFALKCGITVFGIF